MSLAIKVRNINKTINGKKILKDINFDIYEGEIVGLVGANGSGKSTLLKMMSGLYNIESGSIHYYNYDIKKDYEKAMALVGTVIESPDLYGNLSGKKNLEIFKMMFKGIDEFTIKQIVNIVQMEKYLGKKFKTYSLGMKERLAIATSLINKPKILLLDEPTNGLDYDGVKKIMKMIKDLKNTTIIISSHLLSEIEHICNKVIFINDGKIDSIKVLEKTNKKNIYFEVDDFSKARLIIKDYCINENLEVYETDEVISKINKELVLNGLNVYRIIENNNTLEEHFFKMIGKDNDISN